MSDDTSDHRFVPATPGGVQRPYGGPWRMTPGGEWVKANEVPPEPQTFESKLDVLRREYAALVSAQSAAADDGDSAHAAALRKARQHRARLIRELEHGCPPVAAYMEDGR